jgi:hypothetical protein
MIDILEVKVLHQPDGGATPCLPGVVYSWAQRSLIESRRIHDGSPVWITIDETNSQELRERVRRSRKMQKQSNVEMHVG